MFFPSFFLVFEISSNSPICDNSNLKKDLKLALKAVKFKYPLKFLDKNFWSFFPKKVQNLTDFTKNPSSPKK